MCPEATVVTPAETVSSLKENTNWAFTFNYGMPIGSDRAKKPITWPPQAFFKGRSKAFVADLYIKRIEWHEDNDGAIDAIKLTLSDG